MIYVVKKYLTGVSLVALTFSLNSATAYAEGCTVMPDCETLGYTDTDCGEAPALRCPFDQTKLFCGGNDGGSGNNSSTCNIGDIYYSDDTCSPTRINSKTLIGVVIDPVNRLVVSLDEAKKKWSYSETDVAQLTNYGSEAAAKSDVNGKSNTDILVSLGTDYEAANYCHNMTTGGKTWYLPALGEMLPMSNPAVQITLDMLGPVFRNALYPSSTEYDYRNAWGFNPVEGFTYQYNNKYATPLVRCVFKYGE